MIKLASTSTLFTLTLATVLAAFSHATLASDARTLEWDELKPDDWQPPAVRSRAFYEQNPDAQVQTNLDAPVVEELDGQTVRIPGYVVQLEGDDRSVTEFLLVPYFGACIHVPPPPPNQIIHVRFPEGVPYATTYDAVWVEGTIKVDRSESDIAVTGYVIDATEVVSYF
ncbi:DUF3299 domain-containing protein [Aliidiomarina sedimenti]|uniref:DUF3299 domain-containing protein n=1 Tax=Aliidiomarina sedimenti TaxID=1933879 RepID=A0ABY0BUN4_9GAMM|nr:DUF3299 domain-containing protein [Aliidiomarina sedimenti]RUO27942.1 DUF3299 domain-containing protein [Aliidiomarina sedimenti]